MTCIIGLCENEKAWVGGDSSSVDDWTIRQTESQKVFRVGQYVIGYTSSFRMGQILHHHVNYPPCEKPTEAFMVMEFIEAIRKALKDFGYSRIESNQESGGTFIVGVKGMIYEIDSDFQINQPADGLVSIGSGFPFALGAMEALKHLEPQKRINQALEIASYFNGRVKPPYTVFRVEK